MPKKGEKWCVPCRVSTHYTAECVKCEYCEGRGHKWEDCPVGTSVPAYAMNTARTGEGEQQNQRYQSFPRIPIRFTYWNCEKEGHLARDCLEEPRPR